MKRAAIYARVSIRNGHQDPETQLLALRHVAERAGWHVVEEYVDHGISGAKGRDQRPAFDRLLKDATRRKFDIIMAWSVDQRLSAGRGRVDPLPVQVQVHALGMHLAEEADEILERSPEPRGRDPLARPARASSRSPAICALASVRCAG
jgi:hypothetical protein